jgi:16S rRNA G966 N2-methylase RsmD
MNTEVEDVFQSNDNTKRENNEDINTKKRVAEEVDTNELKSTETATIVKKSKFKLKPPPAQVENIHTSTIIDGDVLTTSELTTQLIQARDFLFNNIPPDDRNKLQLDMTASFSITEGRIADRMSRAITSVISENGDNANEMTIMDGMACVGGNTMSFSKFFKNVISNELNPQRYSMLVNNVQSVMHCENVVFHNQSILDLAINEQNYDILFLDPEWGGPNYRNKNNIRLPISNEYVEDFCLRLFNTCPHVKLIVLKLPENYDNNYIKNFANQNNLKYKFEDNYYKMTLTFISKMSL